MIFVQLLACTTRGNQVIFPINNDDTSTSWQSHPSKSELCGQESDLRLDAQCVFSVCGPGVRVMLPGLTADQSVHCSSADQLGPGSVCWSLDLSAGAAACLQHHGERQQQRLKRKPPNIRAWVGHLRIILYTDVASLTLYLNFFMTPRLVRLMSTQTDPASPQPS